MAIAIGSPPGLPDWLAQAFPYKRHMGFYADERMHFVDDGPEDGPAILLVHGNPTWSFLWRKVLPKLMDEGFRVIAPDLVGLGLSSKPTHVKDHSLELQVNMVDNLIEGLKLDNFTIVGQDWGGPTVAAVAKRTRRTVKAAVFGNTAVGAPKAFKTTAFHRFAHMPIVSDIAFRGFNYPVKFMPKVQGDPNSIDETAKRAYAYPLRSWGYRAAPLAMARMVPNSPDHPSMPLLAAGGEWAESFEGPVKLVWGMKDPILGRALKRMKTLFPNAEVTETQAGHFLQEEVPNELADAIIAVSKS